MGNSLSDNSQTSKQIVVFRTINEVRSWVKELRKNDKKIGFVPTMGALHIGHFELVKKSLSQCDYTIATIFVNPIQFGPNEDFDSYPRQEKEDIYNLEKLGCDAVFAPDVNEIFPDFRSNPYEILTIVSVKKLTDGLCGMFRPGHFDGVTTEVLKTFMIILPDIAYFGEKDYQQLMVVKQMVYDLNIPIHIEAVPTVREADGLAVSSRNVYLTNEQRKLAPMIYSELVQIATELSKKEIECFPIIEKSKQKLIEKGVNLIEYLTVVDSDTLIPVERIKNKARVLIAARIGKTRLIDNVPIDPV